MKGHKRRKKDDFQPTIVIVAKVLIGSSCGFGIELGFYNISFSLKIRTKGILYS